MKKKIAVGTRKATASDVAKMAGVSKWTVSRAFVPGASISPKSRERVLQIAEQLNYYPNLLARSLSQERTNIVGLVVDNFENPHKLMMLNETTKQLQQGGKTALILNIALKNNYKAVLVQADQFRVDGLIFLGTVLTDELLNLAKDIKHIPLVVMGRSSELSGIHVVNTMDEQAGADIARLFLAQGYKKLAYMTGPEPGSTRLGRLNGFASELEKHDIALQQILHAGDYIRTLGYEKMLAYLRNTPEDQRVDAIFCENDILAIGCYEAIRAKSANIAIAGFDDIDLASAESFNLTTYRQPLPELVQQSLALIEQPSSAAHFQLRGKLVLRKSHHKPRR